MYLIPSTSFTAPVLDLQIFPLYGSISVDLVLPASLSQSFFTEAPLCLRPLYVKLFSLGPLLQTHLPILSRLWQYPQIDFLCHPNIQIHQGRYKNVPSSFYYGHVRGILGNGSEEIPETEFIIERKKLTDDLNAIDAKLLKLDVDNANLQSMDAAFVEKASYFIMVERIMNGDRDDPVSFIRNVDLSVVKSFLNTIIRKIIILSGKVSSIEFKNGITLEFSYE